MGSFPVNVPRVGNLQTEYKLSYIQRLTRQAKNTSGNPLDAVIKEVFYRSESFYVHKTNKLLEIRLYSAFFEKKDLKVKTG